MKQRIPRDRRRAGVRVVLGQRDEALLRALARFRIAHTGDLTALFFRDVRRDTAATRLRRLHDAGFIQARSGGLNEQSIYQLGPEGLQWAEERGIAAGPSPVVPAMHHLAIIRLWAKLAAALASDETLRLQRFEPDWELRARAAGSGAPVVPDAAIEIVGRQPGLDAGARIALEVDLTTERPGAVRRKLAAYDVSQYFTEGSPVVIVAVLVAARERRASTIRSLLEEKWRGQARIFLESDWPAVLLLDLRDAPLADTPTGKGMAVGVTLRGGADSHSQGDGLSLSDNSESVRGSADTPHAGSVDGE